MEVRPDAKDLPTHARTSSEFPVKLENMFQISMDSSRTMSGTYLEPRELCAQRMLAKDLKEATFLCCLS
jgi:hypothetical protein